MDNSKLISEAILTDEHLLRLYAKKVEIYLLVIPMVILDKNGNGKTIWVDDTNLLPRIDEMINHRIEQIKNFYDL